MILKAKALLADDPYNPGTGVWNTTCDTSQEFWSYDWDLLNRLVTAKDYQSGTTPTSTTSYVYDTSGLRVQRTGSDGVTRYIYSTGGQLLENQNTSGTRTIAYMGSTILGWTDTKTGSSGAVSTRYYAATDQLGGVTAVMDTSGSVVWSSEYTPFGGLAGAQGTYNFSGFFTGKDLDADTGLYYFNARWYDAGLGRFISEDPAGQGSNWYSYGGSNPLSDIGPSGLFRFRASFKTTVEASCCVKNSLKSSFTISKLRFSDRFSLAITLPRDVLKEALLVKIACPC